MKIIGTVTEEEKDIVMDIFEKKYALENLLKIQKKESRKSENIEADLNQTMSILYNWWDKCRNKYNWSNIEIWHINYNTNEIFVK